MSSGSDVKNCSMPMIVSSSSALRFCGRLSFSTATLPCRSAASDDGSCEVWPLDDIRRLILCACSEDHVARSLPAQRSVLDLRTAAFIQRSERLVGRDCLDDLEGIPVALRFRRRLDLEQVHRMDLAAIGADGALTKKRII